MKHILLTVTLSAVSPAYGQTALEFATAGMGTRVPPLAEERINAKVSRRLERSEVAVTSPLDIRTAPQMVADADRFVGTRNPYRFRGPGCKVFVNMIARRNGYYANSSARAIDVARMGTRVSYPQPGDYRYSGRRGGGHAELVAEVRGSTVVTINGNKGGNRVGYSYRSIGSGVYYRPIRYAGL